MSLSITSPEATTVNPNTNAPPQNITFSPALKRAALIWSLENKPPPLSNQFKSPLAGMLSRTNVNMTTMSDTAKTGPAKLCAFFKM